MRKVLFVLLTVLAVMAMFVSCDSNSEIAEQSDLVQVNLAISEDKNLTTQVTKDIYYWEFMARPDFQLAAGEAVYGTVSYWKGLPLLNTEAEPAGLKLQTDLGLYTSGSWLFEVRGLNKNYQVIAIGATRQIIRKGLNNTINVTVYTDRADGTHGESMDETSRVAGATSITPPATGLVISTVANYGTSTSATNKSTTRYGSVRLGAIINRLDTNVDNTRIRVYSQKVAKDGRILASQVYNPSDPGANPSTGLVDGTLNGVTEITGISWIKVTEGNSITVWNDARDNNLHPNASLAASPVGDAKVYYECTISNIDAGPYIYTFVVEGKATVDDPGETYVTGDWIVLGGQAVDVLVVGGETTYVTGTLLANDYVLAGLKITAPGAIIGTINNANYVRGNIATGVDLEFEYDQANSAEAPSKCFWYVNGSLLLEGGVPVTTTTIHFDCPVESEIPQYGIYRISCSPTGELGSIGNQTIDVIYNPPTGPNVGEFDWAALGLD